MARLTNQTSRLGFYIDGEVDYLVFTAAYIGGIAYFLPQYGFWIVLFAILSGFLHSAQTQVYEYYIRDFSYFCCSDNHYRNLKLEEVKKHREQAGALWEKFIITCMLSYYRSQNFVVTRKGKTKERFESLHRDPSIGDNFREAYRETYYPFLSRLGLWGGINSHRTLIIIFILFAHFDYYLLANVFMTFPIIYISIMQAKKDEVFLKSFSK